MTTVTDLSLTLKRTYDVPQERLFNAWLDPEMLRKFMMPGPGMTVPRASNDPVQGGNFEVVMQGDGDELPHTGTYQKISPHEQIVFTWENPFNDDETLVTLTFAPVAGGTELTLQHDRFVDETSRNNHEGGWNNILDALTAAMGGN